MIDYAAREAKRAVRNATGFCRDCEAPNNGKCRCSECMTKAQLAREKRLAVLQTDPVAWAEYRERINARNKASRRAHPDRHREYELRKRHGITNADYERMSDEQGGVCAACGGTDKEKGHGYLHVDHDHATGRVRALLCQGCNKALGYLREDPERIGKLAVYASTKCRLRALP